MERPDGELMIRYHGEAVDFQEGPPPSSALWGAASACCPDPQPQENSHLNEAQRDLLAALESADDDSDAVEGIAAKARGGKGKPIRHQLHRMPTPAQQARWEAVQLALKQGLPHRAIARKLGMSRVAVRKYALAKSPPTKKLSAKEQATAEALAHSLAVAD